MVWDLTPSPKPARAAGVVDSGPGRPKFQNPRLGFRAYIHVNKKLIYIIIHTYTYVCI